ncbi:hypothetical protein HORIV_30920 [Vreelandella olivaria]|uniref:Uncharacterized protein n=1 Tax=Vreelandella olivaria TaxID=390919 RepID=A0ABN5X1G4_9GAMM|nr:hypothetical protein HORIV_30920 [Halomonas olivaria]
MAETNAPPSSPSAYHVLLQLEQQFDHLLETIEAAVSLYEQQLPATWVFNQATPPRDWLRKALFDMWHEQNQDGRETRNYIAVVAANDELIRAIDAVNQAKAHFSNLLQHIKQAFPQALSDAKAAYRNATLTLMKRYAAMDLLAYILNRAGGSYLSHKRLSHAFALLGTAVVALLNACRCKKLNISFTA